MEFFSRYLSADQPESKAVIETSCDIVNLTGETLHFVRVQDGTLVRGDLLESSGPVPEIIEHYEPPANVLSTRGGVSVPVLASYRLKTTKGVRNMRAKKPDTLFIVIPEIAKLLRDRDDLMIPGQREFDVIGAEPGVTYYHGIVNPTERTARMRMFDDSDDDDEKD